MYNRYGKPAVLHTKKLYIIDDYLPEYLDLVTRNWGFWKKPINSSSVGACMVEVDGNLILLGGIQVDTCKSSLLKQKKRFRFYNTDG